MPSSLEIINNFDYNYESAYYAWNPFFDEAAIDLRFYTGDQWNEKERNKLFQEGRNAYVINRIRRNIQLITGYQRAHRLSSVILPQSKQDQQAADDASDLIMQVFSKGNGYNSISDAFGGALKTGWNLSTVWMDYRDDPVNGEIRFGREPYSGFICDPYFTKRDFSDCSYVLRRKYMTLLQAQSLLPKHRKELELLQRNGWSRDDKFPWLPYQSLPSGLDLLAYNESYEQKWKNVSVIVDTETGEYTDWPGDEKSLKEFVSQFPQLEVIQKQKPYMECHIIVNDEHITTITDQYGLNEYPFVPFFGYFEPEAQTWDLKLQSLVRPMRDPQVESNRRRSQMNDIIESQQNSGWIAKKEAVVNPRALYRSGQGEVIWKKSNAQPGDIEKIPPAQIPPSFFQLQELYDRDITEVIGINDAAFGEPANAQESGVMMMLRQGASLISLQDLFDNLRYSQKLLTEKTLKLIRTWTPEKMTKILNREPSPQLLDPNFIKYDISIQEGLLSDTQRQVYFRQLVDLKQLGAPVTGEMLAEAAPIQGKTEYITQLKEVEQQQAQQAQQAAQLQAKQLESVSQMQEARAISDIALSKERTTRAMANLGLQEERASEAVENRSSAALERAKAIKELSMMDDERLLKYMKIVQMMESINKAQEDTSQAEDIQITQATAPPAQEAPQQISQETLTEEVQDGGNV